MSISVRMDHSNVLYIDAAFYLPTPVGRLPDNIFKEMIVVLIFLPRPLDK